MPSSEAETHAVWVGAIAELLRCRSQSERLSTHLFFTSKGSRGTNIDVFLSALRKRSSRRSTLRFRYSRMQDGSRAQLAKKRAMRMPGVCKSAVSVATTPPRRSPLPPASVTTASSNSLQICQAWPLPSHGSYASSHCSQHVGGCGPVFSEAPPRVAPASARSLPLFFRFPWPNSFRFCQAWSAASSMGHVGPHCCSLGRARPRTAADCPARSRTRACSVPPCSRQLQPWRERRTPARRPAARHRLPAASMPPPPRHTEPAAAVIPWRPRPCLRANDDYFHVRGKSLLS